MPQTQFRLRTLLLVVAASASWLAWYQAASSLQKMKSELPGLRNAVAMLVVQDRSEYAVVAKHTVWENETRWDIYLPPEDKGAKYQICFASEGVYQDRRPPHVLTANIGHGTRSIDYTRTKTDSGWRFTVAYDGKPIIQSNSSPTWAPHGGFSSVHGVNSHATFQQSTEDPLILLLRRYIIAATNGEKESGLGEYLWVERIDDSEAGAGHLDTTTFLQNRP